MTKEQLMEAGFNEDQVSKILSMHKEAIDGNFITKHRFDEVNSELKNAKSQVSERDQQIQELKKFEGDSAELKSKIKELEEANELRDSEHKKNLDLERKKSAIKFALLESEDGRPHDADMVLGLFNLDQISIDESTGKLNGFDSQRDTLRKEKTFLFSAKPDSADPNPPTGWKPAGNSPLDGDKGGKGADPSESFGKSLAQIKLGMMGVSPSGNKE